MLHSKEILLRVPRSATDLSELALAVCKPFSYIVKTAKGKIAIPSDDAKQGMHLICHWTGFDCVHTVS